MNFKRVAGALLSVVSSFVWADNDALRAQGEAVYDRLCMACHQTGVASAPIRGDSEAWAPRLPQGFEVLLRHAIDGVGAMPPRGGNPNLSDDEMRAATFYLVEPVMEEPAPQQRGEAPTEPSAPDPADDEEGASHRQLDGEALYARARCASCHATGIAGAPALGDSNAWGERLDKDPDVLYQSVIAGKGVMPPRGASTASDDELKAMVDFMVERSR